MKLSIIIPVFNVELYIRECLQSILAQNFTDYEVILINDGSTDASGSICDRYAEKDPRIRVFHQQNKGVSAARNLGIVKAEGEWIAFIDSDDIIEEGYLRAFADHFSLETDLIIQGIKRTGKVQDILCDFNTKRKITPQEFFNTYRIWPHYFSASSKVFRKNIITENRLVFNETMSYGEDTVFILEYASCTSKVFYLLPGSSYNYQIHAIGLSSKSPVFDARIKLFEIVKKNLVKLTANKQDLYWYSTAALKALYIDKDINNTYKALKQLIKNHKEDILYIYRGEQWSMRCVKVLISYNQYFLLNRIFKFLYRSLLKHN